MLTLNLLNKALTADAMQSHIKRLCDDHFIVLEVNRQAILNDWGRPEDWSKATSYLSRARISPKGIKLVQLSLPPTTPPLYAVALHELGHLLSTKQQHVSFLDQLLNIYAQLPNERDAWSWAERNALAWTVDMDDVRQFCLASYERAA